VLLSISKLLSGEIYERQGLGCCSYADDMYLLTIVMLKILRTKQLELLKLNSLKDTDHGDLCEQTSSDSPLVQKNVLHVNVSRV